jgi:hypothetical protein
MEPSDGTVPLPRLRTRARVLAAVAIVAMVAHLAVDATMAQEITTGPTRHRPVALIEALFEAAVWSAAVAAFAAALCGWQLRAAWRKEVPAAGALRTGSAPVTRITVDPGSTGLRFPYQLAVSFGLTALGAFFLAFTLGNLRYHHVEPFVILSGCCLSVGPLVAGVAWWPFLPRALSTGLRAGQIRAIGLATIAGGVAAGAVGGVGTAVIAFGAHAGNAGPATFGMAGYGALFAWKGSRLVAMSRQVAAPPG